MASDGRMTTSRWIKSKGCWYYLRSDGYMETSPYVFVSIKEQMLYYCENGSLILSTPVVTGNLYPVNHSTPTGTYYLNNKATSMHLLGYNDDGSQYDSFVNYWMPFVGGEFGLHDATWRDSFGDSIYEYDGSHGCVNMPLDSARTLYNRIAVGTMVRLQ
jgi:lipoprotein-anchoring transpeptidase ErfK/SrfK